jgi:hypothetical protein
MEERKDRKEASTIKAPTPSDPKNTSNRKTKKEDYGIKIQQMFPSKKDSKNLPSDLNNQTVQLELSGFEQAQNQSDDRLTAKASQLIEEKSLPIQANFMNAKVENTKSSQLRLALSKSDETPIVFPETNDQDSFVPQSPPRQQRMNSSQTDQSNENSNKFINDNDLTKTVKKGSRWNTSNSKQITESSQNLILDLRINDHQQHETNPANPLNQDLNRFRDSESRQLSVARQPESQSKPLRAPMRQQNFIPKKKEPKLISPQLKDARHLKVDRPLVYRSSRPNSNTNNLPVIKPEPAKKIFVSSQDNDKINLNINITVVIQNKSANQQTLGGNQQMSIMDSNVISGPSEMMPQTNRVSGTKPSYVNNSQKVVAHPAQMNFTRNEFWKRKVSKPEVPKFKHQSFLKDENNISYSRVQKLPATSQADSMKSTIPDTLFKSKKLPEPVFTYHADKQRDKENVPKPKVQPLLPKITAPSTISSHIPLVHPTQSLKKDPACAPPKETLKLSNNDPMRMSQKDNEYCHSHHRPCQSVEKSVEVQKSSKLKLKNELEQLKLSKPSLTNSPYDLHHSNKILRKNFNVEIKILDTPEPQISSNVYNLRYKVCKTNFFMETHTRN